LPAPAASSRETELFNGLSKFFLGVCRQRALCMFMDDLQWADDITLRFLHHLWRQAVHVPLLLVGAFREEEARQNEILVRWSRELLTRHPDGRVSLPHLSESAVI